MERINCCLRNKKRDTLDQITQLGIIIVTWVSRFDNQCGKRLIMEERNLGAQERGKLALDLTLLLG